MAQTCEKQKVRHRLLFSLCVWLETVFEPLALVCTDGEKTAKASRFNQTISQTQQQLVIRQIRPAGAHELQRQRRFPASRWPNNHNPDFASGLNYAGTMQIKQSETSQRSANGKRSHACEQRISRFGQFFKPNGNRDRTAAFELDQCIANREVEIGAVGVTLSAVSNFKRIQIARNRRLDFRVVESDTNVGCLLWK